MPPKADVPWSSRTVRRNSTRGRRLPLTCLYSLLLGAACIFIFVNSSAPNKRSLGATNGLAQTMASVARAVGPAGATSLFAYSVEYDLAGGYAVYAIFASLAVIAVVVGTMLPAKPWTREEDY